jgi:hypothetical protein
VLCVRGECDVIEFELSQKFRGQRKILGLTSPLCAPVNKWSVLSLSYATY